MEIKKTINCKELLEIVIKKWWIFLLLTVIGIVSTYSLTTIFVAPIYEANTVLYIGNEDPSLTNVSFSIGQFEADSQLIYDYKQIALTRLVVAQVINNTGSNIPFDEFKNAIVIQAIQKSRLFTVGFRNTNPQIAKMVSNELAKQLETAALQIVGVDNIRIIDPALTPIEPIAPNKFQNAIVGALLGLIASLSISIFTFLIDDKVKEKEDVDKLIGASVIGSIPKF